MIEIRDRDDRHGDRENRDKARGIAMVRNKRKKRKILEMKMMETEIYDRHRYMIQRYE